MYVGIAAYLAGGGGGGGGLLCDMSQAVKGNCMYIPTIGTVSSNYYH